MLVPSTRFQDDSTGVCCCFFALPRNKVVTLPNGIPIPTFWTTGLQEAKEYLTTWWMVWMVLGTQPIPYVCTPLSNLPPVLITIVPLQGLCSVPLSSFIASGWQHHFHFFKALHPWMTQTGCHRSCLAILFCLSVCVSFLFLPDVLAVIMVMKSSFVLIVFCQERTNTKDNKTRGERKSQVEHMCAFDRGG